jgi:hypothetical protein
MANGKFNLSKEEEKKISFNMSKNDDVKTNKFNLSKEQSSAPILQPEDKKSNNWRLRLLLAAIVVVALVFALKKYSKDKAGDNGAAVKTEQTGGTPQTPATDTPVAEESVSTPATAEQEATSSNEPAVSESSQTGSSAPTQESDSQGSTPAQSAASGQSAAAEKPAAPQPARPAAQPSASVSGDVEQLAKSVIRGDYGVGADRKAKLGSRYTEIQRRVNRIYRDNGF